MEFSRQEYWNELPFPSPGDLLDSGIEPQSSALQADSLPSKSPGKPLLFSYLECHVCACILSGFSCVQLFVTPGTIAHQVSLSMRLSTGKTTGVGYLDLLQEIFPTQVLNKGLLHWQVGL